MLTITVTAKAGDKTCFLVEVAQAGIFQIRNVPEADLEPILGIACANILFPYVPRIGRGPHRARRVSGRFTSRR